jgi:aspartyl-tRNA(Asn)/glutamyl-tRNA(Gln) amidotransferase subunit A
MNSLSFATIKELREQLKNKQISTAELLDFFINRFAAYDGQLGSALEIFDKEWILKNSVMPGTLQGIPGLIKNNIAIKEQLLTCASRILENFRSPYDATVIARLKAQGGTLLGRANLDEFAMGSSTETSYFQKTKNPWDPTRVPGGSSGGSAAAVAAGLVPWALGSETGGSVRQPAAFCGIVGSKPTYGYVSRYGLVHYASSLDQIGVLSRSVYDNALIFSIMAGKDEHDSSTLPVESKDYTAQLDGKLPKGLKIGIVDNALTAEGIDPEVVAAIEAGIQEFEKLGATIHHVSLPAVDYSAAAYFILSRAEAASNLARFDGVRYGFRDKQATTLRDMYEETRHDGFGAEVKKRIMVGNYVLSSGHSGEFYDNAQKVKRLIRSQFVDAFKKVDVLLMPTHPAPAFKLGAFDLDPLQIDLQDYFTCPMNLAGVPAISIPCGMSSSGLPIGFQITAPHLAEELMFKVADAYEQATPWHAMHPKGY